MSTDNEKEIAVIPSFLSLSEGILQHSASYSNRTYHSTNEIIVHLHPRL